MISRPTTLTSSVSAPTRLMLAARSQRLGRTSIRLRLEVRGLGQHLVGAGLDRLGLDAEMDRQMGLGIEVDDDHLAARRRPGRRRR